MEDWGQGLSDEFLNRWWKNSSAQCKSVRSGYTEGPMWKRVMMFLKWKRPVGTNGHWESSWKLFKKRDGMKRKAEVKVVQEGVTKFHLGTGFPLIIRSRCLILFSCVILKMPDGECSGRARCSVFWRLLLATYPCSMIWSLTSHFLQHLKVSVSNLR